VLHDVFCQLVGAQCALVDDASEPLVVNCRILAGHEKMAQAFLLSPLSDDIAISVKRKSISLSLPAAVLE
jgi:hypothetical protein